MYVNFPSSFYLLFFFVSISIIFIFNYATIVQVEQASRHHIIT